MRVSQGLTKKLRHLKGSNLKNPRISMRQRPNAFRMKLNYAQDEEPEYYPFDSRTKRLKSLLGQKRRTGRKRSHLSRRQLKRNSPTKGHAEITSSLRGLILTVVVLVVVGMKHQSCILSPISPQP